MALDIVQEQQGAVRILALRGRLDTDTSADLELAVEDLLSTGDPAAADSAAPPAAATGTSGTFLIDLADVSYVSSAGLRVLLALAKKLETGKGSLRLCSLNPSVTQVFDVAGFSKLFVIFKDRASALAAMPKAATLPQTPTLAQQVALLLRVGEAHVAVVPASQFARDVAQLLGVKPVPAPTAAASVRASASQASTPLPAPAAPAEGHGLLGRLRGLFGAKS